MDHSEFILQQHAREQESAVREIPPEETNDQKG